MSNKDEKWIGEIVGVFTDPIIVMPGGWGDTLPPWLKEAITMERLIMNMQGVRSGLMTGTDAEAVAYLYTASLEAPMGHDWSQIYFYVTGKVWNYHKNKDDTQKFPADLVVEELSRYQMDMLNRLKYWIYEQRLKHRKRTEKVDREGKKEKKKEEELLQLGFDMS